MKNKSFRFDINGLRAISVLFVVIFHYNNEYLPGGFIGVDIFFVISGYLMTSIIFSKIDNDFSFFVFIKRRAERIMPALLATIFLVLLFGFLLIDPLTYKVIGEHSLSSILFISNLIYWSEAGYFDLGAYSKFLLHTWSLSVEWQFYILYPLLILLAKKIFCTSKVKIILLISTMSLLSLSLYLSFSFPSFSYFMLPARAWEMMVGGLAYLYPLKKEINRKSLELTGLTLIIIASCVINSSFSWPGYASFLPVTGAYLCIISNNKNTLLSNRIIQIIGSWSYSIYLVHWPILIFMKKLDISLGLIPYVLLVLILSAIMYYAVESKRKINFTFVFLFIFLCGVSAYVSVNGVAWRVQDSKYQLSKGEFRNKYEGHLSLPQSEGVQYFNSNESDFEFILIGNSHARHFFSYIQKNKIKVASLALDGCISTKNFHSVYDKDRCGKRYQITLDFIKKHHDKKIIWSSLWRENELEHGILRQRDIKSDIINEIELFIKDIKDSNSKIFLLTDTQGSEKTMFECLAKKDLPINSIFPIKCNSTQPKIERNIDTRLEALSYKYSNVFVIKAHEALCDDTVCKVLDNNIPIYTDNSHLSKTGADIVGGFIFKKINESQPIKP